MTCPECGAAKIFLAMRDCWGENCPENANGCWYECGSCKHEWQDDNLVQLSAMEAMVSAIMSRD